MVVWSDPGVQYPPDDMRNLSKDLERKNELGQTKLCLAALFGDFYAFQQLLLNGFEWENEDNKISVRNPLLAAIKAKSNDIIKFIIFTTQDFFFDIPSHEDIRSKNILYRAAKYVSAEMYELMINHGADVNGSKARWIPIPPTLREEYLKNNPEYNFPPLISAVCYNRIDLVEILLKHQANFDIGYATRVDCHLFAYVVITDHTLILETLLKALIARGDWYEIAFKTLVEIIHLKRRTACLRVFFKVLFPHLHEFIEAYHVALKLKCIDVLNSKSIELVQFFYASPFRPMMQDLITELKPDFLLKGRVTLEPHRYYKRIHTPLQSKKRLRPEAP